MEITAYIIINLLLFSSWYLFLFRKARYLSLADRLTGTFLSGLTQIIATEMLLGVIFRQLFPLPLFLFNAFISAGVLTFALRAGGIRAIFTEIREEAGRIAGILRGDKVLLCIFSLFSLSVCWLVFIGYLFPSYSWDALYYHLPMVGQILQSGSIMENPTPSFIQQYMNIFSKNVNLFFLWNIIFLKSDVIADLSQLCFTIAGVLSVYSMAAKLNIKEKYAVYASLLFFFTPVLVLQSTVNYVDGAVSMLFLMAVNFLMDDEREHTEERPLQAKRTCLLLSGLASGILLGSKPTGPLFIIVLLTAVLAREIIRQLRPADTTAAVNGYAAKKELMPYLLYFIVPVFLTGGYWYMRNWIFYGNPVYYMDVSLFGIPVFKGMKSDWVEPAPLIIDNLNYLTRLGYVWLERVEYYMYDSRLSGFGPMWFILFLPGIVFSLTHALLNRKYSFLFISAILLVTFVVHPRNWTTRYVIFIVGLGALSFGYVLDCFNKREKVLKIISLLLAGYAFLTINSPCIMPAKIKEFLLLPPDKRTLSRLKPFNIDIKVRNEYGYWRWIESNIMKGDTLAYTFESFDLDTSRPFFTAPLWNREFSNRVVYIKSESYKEWVKELEAHSVTYILVKRNSPEHGWIEKERKMYYAFRWMGNTSEKFRIVYSDENYTIVKLNNNSSSKNEK